MVGDFLSSVTADHTFPGAPSGVICGLELSFPWPRGIGSGGQGWCFRTSGNQKMSKISKTIIFDVFVKC